MMRSYCILVGMPLESISSQALLMVQSDWMSGCCPFPTVMLFVSVTATSDGNIFIDLWDTMNKADHVLTHSQIFDMLLRE
jgi:hypothetical protein